MNSALQALDELGEILKKFSSTVEDVVVCRQHEWVDHQHRRELHTAINQFKRDLLEMITNRDKT